MRLLRLIENMTMGTAAVGYLPGVHARRRLSAGSAHHDRPSVQHGNEEGTGEEDRKNQVISVKAAAQEKLWRFHVKNGVCLTGRADPKRSLTDKTDKTRPFFIAEGRVLFCKP